MNPSKNYKKEEEELADHKICTQNERNDDTNMHSVADRVLRRPHYYFEKIVWACIRMQTTGLILDYGCGNGMRTRKFAQHGWQLFGIDISADYLITKTALLKSTVYKFPNNIIGTWKMLVADDEEEVHSLTKTVLTDFVYENKSLEIISAYSGEETLRVLENNDDIVLVLLDVVMETDDAGLIVVKKLREELNNNLTQIILRTGQAGKAPELEVVKNYAINDYKEKTELTSQKLFTSIITAIRSYENTKSLALSKSEIDELNYDLNKSIQSFDKSVMAAKIDDKGDVLYVSDAFCNTTQFTHVELIGNKLAVLRHPNLKQEIINDIELCYAQHKPWMGEVEYLTKDNQSIWLQVNRFPEFDNNNNFLHFMTIFENITDKKQVERLNHDMERLIGTFDENVIASKTDQEGKITYASHAFCKLSGYSQEELIHKKHNVVKHQETHNEIHEDLWKTITSKKIWQGEIEDKRKDGSAYWVHTTITPEYDIYGNFICYTAISENITDKKNVEHANNEIALLNAEIEDTQKEVVFRMGAIGEARSKETGMHVKRVAEYSKIFALHLGIPEEKAEILKQASPMHDIGKVAIPDNILNKPGKLTFDEFEIMKTHAQLGYEMLESSNKAILKVAAIVAHEHHEKWDGSGYPRGLIGNKIHVYGRITAVADVFDALGSSRVYKKAWDDEKIFKLFEEEKGKHFDPEIIDILIKYFDEFSLIREQFKDVVN